MTQTLHYCDTEPYLPNPEMLPLELGGVLMKINTIGQTWGSGTTIRWREILAWKITLSRHMIFGQSGGEATTTVSFSLLFYFISYLEGVYKFKTNWSIFA